MELPLPATSSTWQVLVVRKHFMIAWLKEDGTIMVRSYELVIPPMVLASTSASCLYNALHKHPQVAFANRFQTTCE